MIPNLRYPGLSGQVILTILIIAGFLLTVLLIFEPLKKAEANLVETGFKEQSAELEERLVLLQENSLLPISELFSPEFQSTRNQSTRKIKVVVTAYSSSSWETWGDPLITAAGTQVRDGVIANNYLPFGTKVRIPEIYGDKIFVVEDRMSWRKGDYHVDIWFPSYWQALNFGVKRTYIEILEG